MEARQVDFLAYLGVEQENLLNDLLKFRKEFGPFGLLESIYHHYRETVVLTGPDNVIPALYLFVLYHLYFSFSCLLRSHLSESLASTRKAIDATLTAYEIILHPKSAKKYLDRDKLFQHIKAHIKKAITRDPKSYPLAHTLIRHHENCSRFGSHADSDTLIIHRVSEELMPGTDKGVLSLAFFQFPQQKEHGQFYIIATLEIFLSMLLVFKSYFDPMSKTTDKRIDHAIQTLQTDLPALRAKYFSQIRPSISAD